MKRLTERRLQEARRAVVHLVSQGVCDFGRLKRAAEAAAGLSALDLGDAGDARLEAAVYEALGLS